MGSSEFRGAGLTHERNGESGIAAAIMAQSMLTVQRRDSIPRVGLLTDDEREDL
jgi:hypothetical protein